MIRKKNLELNGDLFRNVATRIKKKYIIGFMCTLIAAILYKIGFIIEYVPMQICVVMTGVLLLVISILLLSVAIFQVLWMFIGLGTNLLYRERSLSEKNFKKSFKLNKCSFNCDAVYETAYVPFMGRFVIRRLK